MTEGFEPVIAVRDYYDGPRIGIANFRGLPHHFRSFGWLSSGDWSKDWDSDDDRFFLSAVDAAPDCPEFVVRGEFRVRQPAPKLPPGELRPLEVRWSAEN